MPVRESRSDGVVEQLDAGTQHDTMRTPKVKISGFKLEREKVAHK